MKKYIITIVVIGLVLSQWHDYKVYGKEEVHILYINSYHEGYKWSDDIMSAIEGELEATHMAYNLQVEYLDTLDHQITDLYEYFDKVKDVFAIKYEYKQIDVIITSDDAAYKFVEYHGDELWPDVPVIFCGLNHFDEENIENITRPITGITEETPIKKELALIQKIHPNVKRVHYIVDETITGNNIENNLIQQIQDMNSDIEFIKAPRDTVKDIQDYVSNLTEEDIVLFTIYYYDKAGNYYAYDEAVREIAKVSKVPIYGMWNFHLGNGIIGGNLLDGYQQGKKTIEILNKYLQGTSLDEIPIVKGGLAAEERFDFIQMIKHQVALEDLSPNADIINYIKADVQNVLVVHSYNQGFKWTDDINEGIISALDFGIEEVKPFIEYLDLKKVSSPVYLKQQKEIIENKYENQPIDLIVTSDDGALQFVTKYLEIEKEEIPVVFCGVNYYDDQLLEAHPNITGVIEAYDMEGTIKLMGDLQPSLKKIIVINDTSLTGEGNHKNLMKVVPQFESRYEFEFLREMNMSDIQKKVSDLGSDTAVLLLTFNRDKSNNSYTYEESATLIGEYSAVPIYGLWDFYLNSGIVGGVMSNGYIQGRIAGEMAMDILGGRDAKDIPIVRENANKTMIDNEVFQKFSYLKKEFPEDTVIINQSHWRNLYQMNKTLFNLIIALFMVGMLVIVLLVVLLRATVISRRRIHALATLDDLTGVYNRGIGIKVLQEQLESNFIEQRDTIISFIDINNLKYVNDTYGHNEGDLLIQNCVDVIGKYLSKDDMLCRMGGDEFMVAYQSDDIDECYKVMDVITYHLKRLQDLLEKEYAYSISVGFGVSKYEDPLDINTLIEEADSEMYQNKKCYKQEQMKKRNRFIANG